MVLLSTIPGDRREPRKYEISWKKKFASCGIDNHHLKAQADDRNMSLLGFFITFYEKRKKKEKT